MNPLNSNPARFRTGGYVNRVLVFAMGAMVFAFMLRIARGADFPVVPVVDKQEALAVRGDVERGLWLSSAEDMVYNVGTARADFFAFCADPRDGRDPAATPFSVRAITHLFLSGRAFVDAAAEDADSLRSFVREAHRRGLHVDYVDGDASWINKNAGQANLVMNALAAYQAQSTPEERFDAVTLNVEPYTLRGWYNPTLWNQYLTLVRTMHAKMAAAHTPFGVTIPRWYDLTLGMPALTDVYALVHHVVVLDYVDQERQLIESIANEIALGDSMHVQVYAGVETESNVLANASYHETGWVPMEKNLGVLNCTYVHDPAYAGVVFNNYESFRGMRHTAHTLEFAQNGALPTVRPTAADLTVINGADLKATRADVQRLQYFDGHYRRVLAQLPLTALVTLQAHEGASPRMPFAARTVDVRVNTTAQIAATIARLLKLGVDGFMVDVTPVSGLYGQANPTDLQQAVVDGVNALATVVRSANNKPGAPILLRGGDEFTKALDADAYRTLSAVADGVMPVAPTPLYTANGQAHGDMATAIH